MAHDPTIVAYESTPPAVAEARVVWQGNEFEATLPPRGDRRFMRAIMVGASLAGVGAFAAWMTTGLTAVAAMDTGVVPPMRVLFVTMGVAMTLGLTVKSLLLAYRVVRALRQARMSARVAIEGEMLVLEVPDVFGVRVTRLRLATITAAAVRRTPWRKGERVDLWIEGLDHRGEPLFNDMLYRAADLNTVATAIRMAIIKQTSGL